MLASYTASEPCTTSFHSHYKSGEDETISEHQGGDPGLASVTRSYYYHRAALHEVYEEGVRTTPPNFSVRWAIHGAQIMNRVH